MLVGRLVVVRREAIVLLSRFEFCCVRSCFLLLFLSGAGLAVGHGHPVCTYSKTFVRKTQMSAHVLEKSTLVGVC